MIAGLYGPLVSGRVIIRGRGKKRRYCLIVPGNVFAPDPVLLAEPAPLPYGSGTIRGIRSPTAYTVPFLIPMMVTDFSGICDWFRYDIVPVRPS